MLRQATPASALAHPAVRALVHPRTSITFRLRSPVRDGLDDVRREQCRTHYAIHTRKRGAIALDQFGDGELRKLKQAFPAEGVAEALTSKLSALGSCATPSGSRIFFRPLRFTRRKRTWSVTIWELA